MFNKSISVNQTARLWITLTGAFVALLALLHFLEPEFDPSWRMISEYENGNYGWVMQFAFFCWGGSVLVLSAAFWNNLRTIGGGIAKWWFILIGIAMICAGIFIAKPITDDTVSTADTLHMICGALVIMTFPIAASILAGSLARKPEWAGPQHWLLWGTLSFGAACLPILIRSSFPRP